MTDPRDPVSSMQNLGPAVEATCARAGIHLADELRPLERDLAYVQLIASRAQPHFIGYYAIVMGIQDRPWNDCRGVEKIALCALLNYISIVFQTTVITKKATP